MGDPVMYTATWRLDYADGSGPYVLVEIDGDGVIWLKQNDDAIRLDIKGAVFAYDALRQVVLAAERKAAALSSPSPAAGR